MTREPKAPEIDEVLTAGDVERVLATYNEVLSDGLYHIDIKYRNDTTAELHIQAKLSGDRTAWITCPFYACENYTVRRSRLEGALAILLSNLLKLILRREYARGKLND